MFSALRRCPATLARRVPTTAIASSPLRGSCFRAAIALRIPSSRIASATTAGFHHSAQWQQVAAHAEAEAEAEAEEGAPGANAPITRFADLAKQGLVHPEIINTITKKMRLSTMTDVQARTINEALLGTDIIAQAKTGTGKTLGFLIPVIQRILTRDPKLGERVRGYKKGKADDIRAIIISPTRELAEQIAVEANKIVQGTGIVVQTAVGGTMKRAMLHKTQREGCHLLIGTPGRLIDILSDPYSGVAAPNLNALVMDEADRLLDEGFQKEIHDIKQYLPDPAQVERQNMMFSATIPRDVVTLVRQTLRPGFHFAKCVNDDEAPTHERIPQKSVQLFGFENIMPCLYELTIREHQAGITGEARPFKAIMYFNSTAEVTLAASVMYKLSNGFKRNTPLNGLRAFEIHAKLSQAQRTRAADDFRACKSGLLLSSDVTARGMDFPNVTHVIQIGLPRDRDSYIHRLGRTGRAGKEGEGWIFLTPYEKNEVRRRLRDLPIKDATSELECATIDMSQPAEVSERANGILQECMEAHKKVYPDQLASAFRGLFGSYQWYGDKDGLVAGANRLAEFGWGMPEPPPVPQSVFTGGGGRRAGRTGGRGFSDGGGRGYSDRDRGGFGSDRRGGSRDSNDAMRGGSRSFGGGNRREGGDRGFGGGDRGFGGDRSFGGGDRGFGGGDRGFGGGDRGFGGGDRGFGGSDRGFGGSRDRRGGGDRRGFRN
ncbi:hypothetical protein ACEQ8H_008832 [Pleosporales sp. CAS-2024a]